MKLLSSIHPTAKVKVDVMSPGISAKCYRQDRQSRSNRDQPIGKGGGVTFIREHGP